MKSGGAIVLLGTVVSAAVAVGIALRPLPPPPAPASSADPTDTPTLDLPAYARANLEPVEGYLLDWHIVTAAPNAPPPEPGPAWSRVGGRPDRWSVDLSGLPIARGGAAYARTLVRLPAGEDALLELGSSGPATVWINRSRAYTRSATRPLARMQDFVPVRLRDGVNEILLRLDAAGAGPSFCCRVRRLDGTALDGMSVEAR